MRLNIQQFLEEAEITEAFYPGKKLVKSCRQAGDFKSHCVVLDWRDPDKIRIEIKAGLSGKDLEPQQLKYYPISFQSPTYVDIEIVNDNEEKATEEEEEEEEKGSAKGKGGGGGKKPRKSKLGMADAFSSVIEGKIPDLGKVVDMMIMGKEIAADAYGKVLGTLAGQLAHAKVCATELMAKAGDYVTKYTPPSFLQAKGDETATYSYDRARNADIGFNRTLG